MRIEMDRLFRMVGRDGPDGIRQWELLDVKLIIFSRWYRLAVFLGSPPGSRMGFWRTTTVGGLKGVNYRVRLGSYFRCFTVMAHKRRVLK